MLQHSFVLDALETTAVDTFRHFEILIEEHRALEKKQKDERGNLSLSSSMIPSSHQMSRLRQLVPTIGSFHTSLPLAEAFEIYNEKHRLTKRKHIQISFNEIRHILNLAQVIALRKHPTKNSRSDVLHGGRKKHDESPETLAEKAMLSSKNSMELDLDPKLEERTLDENIPPGKLNGPSLITFDGDQTLYSDGSNFEGNPRLAYYLYQLLRHGVAVAVVTAAGYEYNVEKYEYRLSGLLSYFRQRGLTKEESNRFYLFGGKSLYHPHNTTSCAASEC
jgi:IMP and pyridine-specific 5'-nucleotidase